MSEAAGFTEPMTTLWISLGLPLVLIGYGIYAVVRRGFQMKLLAQDGVAVQGVVTAKLQYGGARGARRNDRRIAYEYRDAAGNVHRHVSMVTSEFWNGHVEGGPIDLVVARSRPEISAPRHLVEASRAALAKAGRM